MLGVRPTIGYKLVFVSHALSRSFFRRRVEAGSHTVLGISKEGLYLRPDRFLILNFRASVVRPVVLHNDMPHLYMRGLITRLCVMYDLESNLDQGQPQAKLNPKNGPYISG